MCDMGHHASGDHFGFLVDRPVIRQLIAETERVVRDVSDLAARVEALKPAFSALLSSGDWLPDEYAQPDLRSGMGGGIGQYALYRAGDGSLCLFSLVIPPGAETPVHDHLAWGLIGVYRGRQDETVYRRLDDGAEEERATLEVARRQTVEAGRVLRAPAAGGRHSLRQDRVRHAIDLDSPARERHGVRLATPLRSGEWTCRGVSIGLQQRPVPRGCREIDRRYGFLGGVPGVAAEGVAVGDGGVAVLRRFDFVGRASVVVAGSGASLMSPGR